MLTARTSVHELILCISLFHLFHVYHAKCIQFVGFLACTRKIENELNDFLFTGHQTRSLVRPTKLKMEGHPVQFLVAPMVAQSDAPFRVLCLRHGATMAYTEMLYTECIARDDNYLSAFLPKSDETLEGNVCPYNPTVVQICGNDPEIMAAAVTKIVSHRSVAAIDLNLGCPQDRARDGLFGSFLLDKQHWPRVCDCVRAAVAALNPHNVPFYCKIRLIESNNIVETTTQFCRGLIEAGAALICIHGRTRGSTKHRRCGPADLTAIATIAATLYKEYDGRVPIISNGNITTAADALHALRCTHPCSGVMSAEGILANPALFHNLSTILKQQQHVPPQPKQLVTDRSNGSGVSSGVIYGATPLQALAPPVPPTSTSPAPSLLALFREYCELSATYAALGGWIELDAYCLRKHGGSAVTSTTTTSPASATSCAQPTELRGSSSCGSSSATTLATASSSDASESRQMYIARQHLQWMLGKTGHGRTVRYTHLGAYYKKHVHLMNALKEATSLDNLLLIAERCLPS